MPLRGFVSMEAAIATVVLTATLFTSITAINAITGNYWQNQVREIEIHAELEKALSTCFSQGGVAKCNSVYYFYGEVDSFAPEKIGSGGICISRLVKKNNVISRITACNGGS